MSSVSANLPLARALRADDLPFNPWIVALTVTLATFMEVLDTSIANVSLPHIAGTLSATQEESTWVLTSYLVSNAIILPLSGWLSALMGRKRFYMTCVALFTASSALCGMATSLPMLVCFRVLQGIGGGGLQPSEQAILVDTFPASKRGMAMAVYTIAVLCAPVLGPTLGGWITDNYSWRWIFYINVPVGILSLVLTSIVLRDPPYLRMQREARRRGPRVRVDFAGLGFIAIGLAALELVLDKGQEEDWFASRLIVAMAVIAVVALVVAVIWELRHPQPIVNLRLYKERNFALACVLVFFVYASLYASTVLLPQMLQTLMGYSATQAGLVLSPAGLVTMLEMPIVGYLLMRGMDARQMIAAGLLVVATASWWMSGLNLNASASQIVWLRIVQVLGAGLMFVPINTIAYRFIPKDQTGNASGLFALVRNEGSGIGVALVTTLLQRHMQVHQHNLASRIDALNPLATEAIRNFSQPFAAAGPDATTGGLRLMYAMVQRQAAILSYLDLFRMFSIAVLMVVPLVFLMRPAKAGKGDGEAVMGH
jgi:MFS transporter, DHA2 family, multidrug resistance protein